jgi:anti-sigma factor RsiW
MNTIEAMDCNELVELVTEHLETALTPAARARFDAHIAECPGCAEILEQFRAVVVTTGALRPRDAEAIDPVRRSELLDRFRAWRDGAET